MDRTRITLTQGWRFHKGDLDDAWYKGYDDTAWRYTTVPHDWSVESPFSRENSSGTGYLDGGIGWYRIHFKLPFEYKGKNVRVTFDGIYKNSQVWVNSYYFGRRPSGYAEISYDISYAVRFGEEENVIAVRVSHPDTADSRWFTGSGIYRKVQLEINETVHPVHHGIVFTADDISAAQASVAVCEEIENTSSEEKCLTVTAELMNRITRETVFSDSCRCTVPAGGKTEVTLRGIVQHPDLWSVDEPALYDLRSIYSTDEESWTADLQKVGIRKLTFDAERGFFLNDVPMKMKGVCLHHDAGVLGAAVRPEIWQRRLSTLKACGCNAIRMSHNPHMPELYDLCDVMGFLVMDEAFDEWEGPKNKWTTGHNVYPPKHQGYYMDFPEWHEEDLRTMVRRDRNHPSVVIWSIGNEIDYPNDPYCHPKFKEMTGNNDANKPAAERQYDPAKPNMERIAVLAKELVKIVKEEDTTRPVTAASAFPELSNDLGFTDDFDIIAYNYKEQLYEEDHRRYPEKPMIGSENGKRPEAWKAVTDHAYVMGQFLWTGVDYLGEAHGWPVYGAASGLIYKDGFPKIPDYYERAALWDADTEQPVVSDSDAVNVRLNLWQEADILKNMRFDNASDETGYLFQIETELLDAEGNRTTDDHMFRVQVEGAGELAGMENGSNADLTPYSENYRSTFRGTMSVYVRRTGRGDIRVRTTCIDEKKGMLKGRSFEVDIH